MKEMSGNSRAPVPTRWGRMCSFGATTYSREGGHRAMQVIVTVQSGSTVMSMGMGPLARPVGRSGEIVVRPWRGRGERGEAHEAAHM